jgi:hypothetical protein
VHNNIDVIQKQTTKTEDRNTKQQSKNRNINKERKNNKQKVEKTILYMSKKRKLQGTRGDIQRE